MVNEIKTPKSSKKTENEEQCAGYNNGPEGGRNLGTGHYYATEKEFGFGALTAIQVEKDVGNISGLEVKKLPVRRD